MDSFQNANGLGEDRNFELRSQNEEGLFTIELEGELDLAVVDRLHRLLPQIEALTDPRVVVDLTGLHFIDSTGMHALITMDRTVASLGGVLILIRGPEALMRAFEHVGLDSVLTFAGQIEERAM